MTKPMPTTCIKEHLSPSWLKFKLLLETVDLDDEISLMSISNLMRKEILNPSTCIMKFCHPLLKNEKF